MSGKDRRDPTYIVENWPHLEKPGDESGFNNGPNWSCDVLETDGTINFALHNCRHEKLWGPCGIFWATPTVADEASWSYHWPP